MCDYVYEYLVFAQIITYLPPTIALMVKPQSLMDGNSSIFVFVAIIGKNVEI